MKKTDTLLKIISFMVFLAMAAYLGVYMVQRVTNPVQTALTVTATMSDAAPMSGLVIRNETVIQSSEQYIDVTVGDGGKVAAGEAVAVIYGSEDALERASRLHTLSQEIEEVSASLTRAGTIQVAGDREQSIYNAITGISASLRGGDMTDVETQGTALASILFRADIDDTATDEYLDELQQEYSQLLLTSAGDTKTVNVEESGTFSTVVDGYEGVDPDYAANLDPAGLRELIAAERSVDQNAIGKLITSYNWYYAAIVPADAAKELVAGMNVKLSFGRYFDGQLNARVEALGRAQGGEQVAVFRLEKGMTEMLAVRAVSADLVYENFTGLRVPVRSLYRYYAGYVSDVDCQHLAEGDAVTLTLGNTAYEAFVSEIGSATPMGELAPGVESGSEADLRPRRRLVVFCWPWSADDGVPNTAAGTGIISVPGLDTALGATNYYEYDPDTDRMCVFTMTGMQAERKIVSLIFAGDEYCLLSSEGGDALREGNEVIVQAKGLHNGKVFS